MANSLEAVTSRYIDFYQVQDGYGNNMSQAYTICRINADGKLTNEIVTGKDLKALCAINPYLADKFYSQGIGTDYLDYACFRTTKLSRFIKYGLDDNGNLYAYNYTGERMLITDDGPTSPSSDTQSILDNLQNQYNEKARSLSSYQSELNSIRPSQEDIDRYNNAISVVERQLNSQKQVVQNLLNERNRLYQRKIELEDELNSLSNSLIHMHSGDEGYDELSARYMDLSNELYGITYDQRTNEVQLEYESDKVQALQIQYDDVNNEYSDLLDDLQLTKVLENSISTLQNEMAALQQQINSLDQTTSFYSPIAETYNITWGNITANGLSIMRLIMLMTIARAESVEASLVEQMDELAKNSELLRKSASIIEFMLRTADATPDEYMSGWVFYEGNWAGIHPVGQWLEEELKIDSSIVLPKTGGWSIELREAVIKAIEDRQDALNVISQETSIAIQSLINKRDQCYLLGSNATKLLYSGNLSVARNI